MTQEELNKKLDSFVKKYEGKTKGYPTDSSYQGECLSIAKLYIKEVFGIDAPPSGSNSAYGYWSNFPNPLPDYFEKVSNTPNGIPTKGCLIIWNTATGDGYGHIAIYTDGDVNTFTSFDQNWGGRQAHLQNHDYSNVVGWLAPKLSVSTTTPQPGVVSDPKAKIDLGKIGTSEYGIVELQALRSQLLAKDNSLDDKGKELIVVRRDNKILQDRVFELEKQLIVIQATSKPTDGQDQGSNPTDGSNDATQSENTSFIDLSKLPSWLGLLVRFFAGNHVAKDK